MSHSSDGSIFPVAVLGILAALLLFAPPLGDDVPSPFPPATLQSEALYGCAWWAAPAGATPRPQPPELNAPGKPAQGSTYGNEPWEDGSSPPAMSDGTRIRATADLHRALMATPASLRSVAWASKLLAIRVDGTGSCAADASETIAEPGSPPVAVS